MVAEIHTQATILRKTTLVLGEKFPGTQGLASMGRIIPAAGAIADVLQFAENADDLVRIYSQYYFDIKRRCDNNYDTPWDLATILASLSDVAFPAPVWSAYLWEFYWDALSNFYGWNSTCEGGL
jgi:hypothetical protein